MDLDKVKDIIGSTYFAIAMILVIIGLGVFLRLTFRGGGSEYKHRPDDE